MKKMLKIISLVLVLSMVLSTTVFASVYKGIHNKTTKYGLPTY